MVPAFVCYELISRISRVKWQVNKAIKTEECRGTMTDLVVVLDLRIAVPLSTPSSSASPSTRCWWERRRCSTIS